MDALCGPGKHWAQNGNSGRCEGGPQAPATQVDGGMTTPPAPVPAPAVTWGTPDMYQQPQPDDTSTQPGDYPTPSPDDDNQTA
jgi:hypothetical protein